MTLYDSIYVIFACIAVYIFFSEKDKRYLRLIQVGFWSLPFWGALIGMKPMWLGNIATAVVLTMALEILVLRRKVQKTKIVVGTEERRNEKK